jgi:hypothetical protein
MSNVLTSYVPTKYIKWDTWTITTIFESITTTLDNHRYRYDPILDTNVVMMVPEKIIVMYPMVITMLMVQ